MERNIFKNYDDTIISKQFKELEAINASSNLNSVSNNIVFYIDCDDDFVDIENVKFCIKGRLVKKDGTAYAAASSIKLVDNFPAHLFKTIEVLKDKTIVEHLENVGRVSTISGIVTSGTLKENINSGFKSTCKGGKFVVCGNLSDFGLGFFKYNLPMYKGKIRITFMRNSDEDAIYRWGTDANLPGEGKIIIDEFKLKIPVIRYHEENRINLMDELTGLSKKGDYKFVFSLMECLCDINVPDKKSSYDWNFGNIQTPAFVFVAFQTDRFEKDVKDSSNFDCCNVKNISILCDKFTYPQEQQNCNFKESDFPELYDMFNDYRKAFNVFPLMPFTPTEFKDDKPIFVFDLSRHPNILGSKDSKVILRVEFNENIPANTRCYVCFQTLKEFDYNILKNTTTEVV